jgi:hypothetical protein
MLLIAAATGAVAQDCPSTNLQIAAVLSNDPGFVGLYKYTITGSWNLGAGLHTTGQFNIALADSCECACNNDFVQYGDDEGSSSGVAQGSGNACTADYNGLYFCQGQPSIGITDPIIRFQATGQNCETQQTTGTWTFYSPLAPGPSETHEDAVILRYGSSQCTGDLVGTLPDCRLCTVVPNEPRAWGDVKIFYR